MSGPIPDPLFLYQLDMSAVSKEERLGMRLALLEGQTAYCGVYS